MRAKKVLDWSWPILLVLLVCLCFSGLTVRFGGQYDSCCPLTMMEIGEHYPLVLKCAGELAPSLVAYLIPHYFSLPLHKMELEPLLKENMFRSPPDAAFNGWKGETVEDRGHLKMLPHSVHKFVCELNALDPASRDCRDALPIREESGKASQPLFAIISWWKWISMKSSSMSSMAPTSSRCGTSFHSLPSTSILTTQ
jgi:hypothetical protein